MNDMIKIKLAVEGMRAEIVKAFDVRAISDGIRVATEKAVAEFDMESYIQSAVESVFTGAREAAVDELRAAYGHRWADEIKSLVDEKIGAALRSFDKRLLRRKIWQCLK